MTVETYHSIPGPLLGKLIHITCGGCHHKIWTTLRVSAVDGDRSNWYAICPRCGFINHPVLQGMISCQVAAPMIE